MDEPPKPSAWARFRNWMSHLHFRLVTIEDTPHSIALGVAIGIFFGFTPLWSLKTLLSIGVAWVCKSTIHLWRCAGLLKARRYDNRREHLFEPPAANAPKKHQHQNKTTWKLAAATASPSVHNA